MSINLQQHLVDSEWTSDGHERPPLGLLIRPRISNDYVVIRAQFVRFDPEDDKPRNLSIDQPLRDVIITGQANRDRSERPFDEGRIYAYRLEIEPIGGMSTQQARRTVAAMGLIERRVDSMRTKDEHGYADPVDFNEWFYFVVRACGLTDGDIVIYQGEPRGMYTDSDFQHLTIEAAVRDIEDTVKGALK